MASTEAVQHADVDADLAAMDPEQLPVPKHRLLGNKHFAGLYSAEHVSATEFVFGATFVALGAGVWDILGGLVIGNLLAVLSFWLLTTPIARQARLSLYTYLQKIAGDSMSRIYNGTNAVIFVVISAAMITVSATAIRKAINLPPQVEAYPTSLWFVLICVVFSVVAVVVAVVGFNALSEVAGVFGPWLIVMFAAGGMVLLPALAETVTGYTTIGSFSEFVSVAGSSVFTGINADGEPGIGMLEVVGFAWAANTFAHFGMIDMALLRYAKKGSAGLTTVTGMFFGHYVAWIAAGIMGAATAAVTLSSITVLEPGDVAWNALGTVGFIAVVVAGWSTANPNIYRAGLAAQAVFPKVSRVKVTVMVGAAVAIASCFPFVYKNMLPLLTYAGLILVPVGGIIFAEHHVLPRLGWTRFWAKFKGARHNVPALVTWPVALVFAGVLQWLDLFPYYYLFVPTFVLAAVLYTLLAKRFGAAEKYPEEEEKERRFNQRVEEFHARRAEEETVEEYKDPTPVSTILLVGSIICLGIVVVFAARTLLFSPDLFSYYVNREQFFTVALVTTLIYFVTSYGSVQWNKFMARRIARQQPPEDSEGTSRRHAAL